MGKIEKILKKGPVEGQTTEVYPVTSTKAVYDENNKRLDNIITGLQESVYLNTPIPISSEDTPEANAQNVKNIADYVEKAKAAGIASVDGIGVTCIIDEYYSAVGYLYGEEDFIGILLYDDNTLSYVSIINGIYNSKNIIIDGMTNQVTSSMLVKGARKPIILTPDTTEVDEETYQKLLSDDVDVIFKDSYNILYYLFDVDKNVSVNDIEIRFVNTIGSIDTTDPSDYYFSVVSVKISKNAPHTVITESTDHSLQDVLNYSGYLNKSILAPVLQNINLAGTDEERKAKLDQFARNWKTLTGASDLNGARFVGNVSMNDGALTNVLLSYDMDENYSGISMSDDVDVFHLKKIVVHPNNGSVESIPLFSHLEAITISTDNTPESKAANVAAIEAYEDNLEALSFDMTKGYMIPITASGRNGFLSTRSGNYPYVGYVSADSSVSEFYNILILGNGEYYDSKIQSESSEELNTISKKLVPAINEVNTLAKNKQDTLTSGTNIKTINNQSLLGSGNIEISASSITADTSMSDTSTNPVQNKVIKAYIDGLVGNVAAQLAQI